MKNRKRILSVKIKHMIDDSPDTSHMGKYSDHATSEFSIDRAHSEDCASIVPVNQDGVQKLRNARAYIVDLQNAVAPESQEWEDLEDAYNVLDTLADETPECDCGERGDMGRNEYRYFNPSFNYVDKNGKATDTPENVRKCTRQDYERMERLNKGDWCYIGIRVEAEIGIAQNCAKNAKSDSGVYIVQHIASGGLWGIESDSERSYLDEVQAEELSALKSELLALGFSRRAIATAFKSVEEVSD
jgi:hypothetical protein